MDGVGSAAWPIVRSDLDLTYVQIGLLLSVPEIVASFVEPVIGILGDVGYRKLLVLGGGLAFAASLVLVSASQGFVVLLIAWVVFFPASGAFVSLSQASLMDAYPTRREQNMARWTFTGSVGNVLGPLGIDGGRRAGSGMAGSFSGDRGAHDTGHLRGAPNGAWTDGGRPRPRRASFAGGMRTAISALRRFAVVKWLIDTLKGFLALYMVDVIRVSESSAALTIAVLLGVGLVGDFLLIPLLDRVRGLTYLRFSVAAVLLLYPTFLLVPSFELKLAAIGLLGFANAGWYSILQGQAYSSMPGRSGTIVALGNVFGLAVSLIPLGLGVVSTAWGLDTAMWLLLAGPVLLLIGIARTAPNSTARTA